MKVFESLNCCLCKSPFVPIANQPKSPRHLVCGKAVCHECFKVEKALNKEERQHQCDNTQDCFYNQNFAYYLIEVLSEVTLFQSPIQSGYVLHESLKPPECPICHEEFSTKGQNQPTALFCLHNICWGCFEQCRKPNEGISKGKYAYRVKCPLCLMETMTNKNVTSRYQFIEFLEELPEMCLQLEEMQKSSFRFCDDCKSLERFERIFDCASCNTKICGNCAFQKHNGSKHKVTQLLKNEAMHLHRTMREEALKGVALHRAITLELHRVVGIQMQDFQERLVSKCEVIGKKRTFETLQKSHDKCKRLKSEFVAFTDKYTPALKEYNRELEDLIKELEQEPD